MTTTYIVKKITSSGGYYDDTTSETVIVYLSNKEAVQEAIDALDSLTLEVYAVDVFDTFGVNLPQSSERMVYGGFYNLSGSYVRDWIDQ